MPGQSTVAPALAESIIELEIAPTAGPGWLGTGAAPVTVSLTAETVRLDGTNLHFLTGDTVVRTVPREDVAAMTWKGHPPRRRPPGYRNVGALWTDEERALLGTEVRSDLSWTEIGRRHERSVSAVRREAVRLRLVDELGRRLDVPETADPAHAAPDPAAQDATALTTTGTDPATDALSNAAAPNTATGGSPPRAAAPTTIASNDSP